MAWIKRIFVILCVINSLFATELINIFPMDKYPQNIESLIRPDSPDYDTALVRPLYQLKQLSNYYNHYYTSTAEGLSAWSSGYVKAQLFPGEGNNIIMVESEIITGFYKHDGNPSKTPYGENYRPYTYQWFQDVANNMDLSDDIDLDYNPDNRAIVVDNLDLRILPTIEPLFYSHLIAGEGYPFDNLQETTLFIGMPLYVVKQSADKAWSLVISSDAIGWVKTRSIAKVSAKFIRQWQSLAHNNGIIAPTKNIWLTDGNNQFHGSAYIGSSLPLVKENREGYLVMIPAKRPDGYAKALPVLLARNVAAKMPLTLNPHNMAKIMHNMIGRQYGWGGMLFNNDCSAETKALFTPFGIYLPRNSQDQSQAGETVVNLDKLNGKQREAYLIAHGHKFTTLVQIPGHIMLYIGNHANPYSKDHLPIAMSYQNVWGLRTAKNDSRFIIGGAVLFPLLQEYPENAALISLYDKSRSKFRLIYLDDNPTF